MCIDFDGHHSGGSSFVYVNDFCYYKNCCIPTSTSSALIKNRSMSPSIQYSIVSHPRLGSDPPFGSDRDRGVTGTP